MKKSRRIEQRREDVLFFLFFFKGDGNPVFSKFKKIITSIVLEIMKFHGCIFIRLKIADNIYLKHFLIQWTPGLWGDKIRAEMDKNNYNSQNISPIRHF